MKIAQIQNKNGPRSGGRKGDGPVRGVGAGSASAFRHVARWSRMSSSAFLASLSRAIGGGGRGGSSSGASGDGLREGVQGGGGGSEGRGDGIVAGSLSNGADTARRGGGGGAGGDEQREQRQLAAALQLAFCCRGERPRSAISHVATSEEERGEARAAVAGVENAGIGQRLESHAAAGRASEQQRASAAAQQGTLLADRRWRDAEVVCDEGSRIVEVQWMALRCSRLHLLQWLDRHRLGQ